MAQAVTEFLRDVSLLGLLNLLTATVFVLFGLVTLLVSRRPRRMGKRLAWGMVPLLVGLVTMYLAYRISDKSMHGRPSEEAIASNRRDALIHGVIGTLGAAVFVATGMAGKARIGNEG